MFIWQRQYDGGEKAAILKTFETAERFPFVHGEKTDPSWRSILVLACSWNIVKWLFTLTTQ